MALEKESRMRAWSRAEGRWLESQNTLTNVVFPVPPSPTTRRTRSIELDVDVVGQVVLDHGSIARENKDSTGRFARPSEISNVPIGRLTEDKLEGGDFGCSHCNNLEKEIEKRG